METKNTSSQNVLREIFDIYADEYVSDEQVQRIMTPVLQTIKDRDDFKKQKSHMKDHILRVVRS